MKILQIQTHLLEIPTDPPRASAAEMRSGRKNTITTLAVIISTDQGIDGIGFAYFLQGSSKSIKAIADYDLIPIILDANCLNPEELYSKIYWRIQTIGRTGLVAQVYSAFDMAMWDIKGKVEEKPLFKLLGGERKSVEAYISHTGWLWMTPEQIVESTQPFLDQKIGVVKLKVGLGPEKDKARLLEIRKRIGSIRLAVDANEKYSLENAREMGKFLQNEINAEWFEEPLTCEDPVGHSILAEELMIPIAAGEMLFSLGEFQNYFLHHAMDIAQPDITRLGGLTPFLLVLEECKRQGVPVNPHLLPEVSLHFSCAFKQVVGIEYMPWLKPLFKNYPDWEDGKLQPLPDSGLGLEFDAKALAQFRSE